MGQQVLRFNILSEREQTRGRGSLRVALRAENLKTFARNVIDSKKEFSTFYKQLYLNLTLEIHKYLIRLTPAHTGKLRGGWTGVLDKYQRDYTRQIQDTSLYDAFKKANKTVEYREYAFDSNAIKEGQKLSQYKDALPTDTEISITNNVPYKDIHEFGTSEIPGKQFTLRAAYKGELWFEQEFKKWLKKIEDAGAVVPPDQVPEIDS